MFYSQELRGPALASYAYRTEIAHEGLHKYRVVSAPSQYELDRKVAAQLAQWDEQWERKQLADKRANERLKAAKDAEKAQARAAEQTRAAESVQEALDTILIDSIDGGELTFSSLKSHKRYPVHIPLESDEIPVDPKPSRSDARYNPKPDFLTKLSKKRMKEFEEANERLYQQDMQLWTSNAENVKRKNQSNKKVFEAALAEWNTKKKKFEAEQTAKNAEVDAYKSRFELCDPSAVPEFIELAVDAIKVPLDVDFATEAEYHPEDKSLILDCFLPTIGDIPSTKKIAYVKSTQSFKESVYSDSYLRKKYDSVIYQLVLRIVECVYRVTKSNKAVDSMILNGRVSTVDKSTGADIQPYVLSLTVSRSDFDSLNLSNIDPKAWFKSSKGVSAASVASVTPVAPIAQLNREDKRFVEGYEVESQIGAETNLAAMDWQDFENLIRELFEQEFSSPGGEVKITQASRDGGVDAVAFDPDPIRGGKIVIQAKRYTNTVGVSAVRDLYGTMMNEGAMKGILVTTSNYGNDAYDFAKGKPLTLLNGANLLHLLEKHGHKARIDLKEAKQMLAE